MRSWNLFYVWVVCLIVCRATLAADEKQPATAESIARLIRELDDDSFRVRNEATRELSRIGGPVLSAVRAATGSRSLEVRVRAERLVREISSNVGFPQLQGTWIGLEGHTFTVRRRFWSWEPGSKMSGTAGSIDIRDVNADRIVADMYVYRGWSKGRTVKAIFRRDGQTLHYCGTYDKPRPVEFEGDSDPYYVGWQLFKK